MVEAQLDDEDGKPLVPTALLIAFAVCTTLLVSVHLLALLIATCTLPDIEAYLASLETTKIKDIACDPPHRRLALFIEISWLFSTAIGVLLFLMEIGLVAWVKMWNYGCKGNSTTTASFEQDPVNCRGRWAATASTLVLVPVSIAFVAFAIYFYKNLVARRYEKSSSQIKQLERMVTNLGSNPNGLDYSDRKMNWPKRLPSHSSLQSV